jgi:hypothetical protein
MPGATAAMSVPAAVFLPEVMAAMNRYIRTYPERADVPPPEEVVAYFAANDVCAALAGMNAE